MTKSVLAELVTQMTVESEQFKKELERSAARTATFSQRMREGQKESQNFDKRLVELANRNQRYTKAANDAAAGSNRLSAGFRHAANSASILTGPFGGISSRLSFIATGLNAVGPAALAAGVALGGITAIIGNSLPKFAEYEKGLLRTEALVKSTGFAAGKNAEDLERLARSTALNTLASVDGARQAVNILQSFRSVSGETFDRTIAVAQDLAAVMGSDIKTAALQLGKALEEPENGLNALRRSGVSFTESQKELIKNLVETGQQAEAQRKILDVLEGQIGGAGGAEAGGLSGAVDTASQRWQELLEGFAQTTGSGKLATDTINRIARGMGVFNQAVLGVGETRETRLAKISQELIAVRNELERVNRFTAPRTFNNLLSKQADLLEELNAINQKTIQEGEIAYQGALRKRQEEIEAEAARVKARQEAGLKIVTSLEQQLLSEEAKINTAYEKRRDQINELVLSEVEIRRRGFETIEQLRKQYLTDNTAERDQALKTLKEQEESKRAAAQRQQAQAESARQRDLEGLENQLQTEQEKIEANYLKQVEQIEQLVLREQEIRARGFETIEQLRQHYLLRADVGREQDLRAIEDRNQREIDAEQKKQEQLAKMRERETLMQQIMVSRQKLITTHGFLDNLQAATAHSKRLRGIHKAAAIAQATVNTYTAASQALAAPFPWPIPQIFAATAVAAGLANVAAIRSQDVAGSYEGGGYTWDGPRSGGMDGRGGRLAILHPQETVIDHLSPGNASASGGQAPISISMTVPQGTNPDEWYTRNRNRILRDLRSELNRRT